MDGLTENRTLIRHLAKTGATKIANFNQIIYYLRQCFYDHQN